MSLRAEPESNSSNYSHQLNLHKIVQVHGVWSPLKFYIARFTWCSQTHHVVCSQKKKKQKTGAQTGRRGGRRGGRISRLSGANALMFQPNFPVSGFIRASAPATASEPAPGWNLRMLLAAYPVFLLAAVGSAAEMSTAPGE